VTPGVVTVCITSYPPFMFYNNVKECPDPCPYATLKGAMPMIGNPEGLALAAAGNANPNHIASDSSFLQGFDRDVIKLVFEKMLSLPVTFVAISSFANTYIALLDGKCDVAITASQMDPTISQCAGPVNLTSAAAALYDYNYGDYGAGNLPFGDYGVSNQIACLQFGQAYVTGGFALMSLVDAAPFDPIAALFSPEVCNAATAILIIVCSAGFLVSLLERGNMHLGTPSRGVYWAALTFLASAEEQPRKKPARILMVLYLLANIVGLTVLTSIVSAKLTTSALSVTYILTLQDVTGTLCIENNYQVLLDYVNRDPGKPVSVTFGTIDECVERLVAKDVQAVITDRSVLQWYMRYYQVAGGFVGPVLQSNPFAFVFKSDNSALMSYVNPSIIAATQTDTDWIPLYSAIGMKYFGADSAGAPPEVLTLVDRRTLIVSLAMFGGAILYALINGDWGPGIPGPKWLRKAIEQPSSSADMSEEEAALMGDDLAFTRLMIHQIKDLRAALGLEETYVEKTAADAEAPAAVAVAKLQTLSPMPSFGHPGAGGDVAHAMMPLLAEMREMRRDMALMQAQMLAQGDIKLQVQDLKHQLRGQEVLKAQMMEMHQRLLAAGGALPMPLQSQPPQGSGERRHHRPRAPGSPSRSAGAEAQPPPAATEARSMPQLPFWGLDRRG
jgi:ABC-type amino acid transport substrate-binding protein